MMNKILFSIVIALSGFVVVGGCAHEAPVCETLESSSPVADVTRVAHESPGLLLIAHGSPSPHWNRGLFQLEKDVQAAFKQEGNPFHAVKLVFMEFATPTIADGVAAMESAGCDSIVVVPLLIAPSSHSHWDVPSLLGLYTDKRMEEVLREEGATVAHSRLPITITSTMDQGDLFEQVLLRRVRALSKDPSNEAVVVLAHGDEGLEPIWGRRMRKVMTYLCGKTGISYGDYAFVHVGQSYDMHGVPVIAGAAEERQRVLVVGCYLSMGVSRMHKRFTDSVASNEFLPVNPLEGKDIQLAEYGLLPDPSVTEWVVQTAKRAVSPGGRFASAGRQG